MWLCLNWLDIFGTTTTVVLPVLLAVTVAITLAAFCGFKTTLHNWRSTLMVIMKFGTYTLHINFIYIYIPCSHSLLSFKKHFVMARTPREKVVIKTQNSTIRSKNNKPEKKAMLTKRQNKIRSGGETGIKLFTEKVPSSSPCPSTATRKIRMKRIQYILTAVLLHTSNMLWLYWVHDAKHYQQYRVEIEELTI